jgi:uncharacterized protein (TIGR02231 family)
MSIIRALSLVGLILLATPSSYADEILASSQVTAATVYADRATVTRAAEITVTPGDHVAVFNELPALLNPDTLRAEGTSTAGVTLGAVDSALVNAAQVSAPRERELTTKLQERQDARALLAAEQAALQSRLTFVGKIGEAAVARTNQDIQTTLTLKPDEWVAAAQKIGTLTVDTTKAIQTLAVQLRTLDQEIAAIQRDLDAIRTDSRQTYSVRVPFTARGDGTLTIKLQYQIQNASWQPLYDARLATDAKKLDLIQFGQVRQATGEEWRNIALTLSTAQPSRGSTPPNLYTWWVSLYDQSPQPMGGAVSAPTLNRAGYAADKEAKMMEMADGVVASLAAAPAEFQAAQIVTGGYVAEYKVPGTVTIAADQSAKKVMIQKLSTSTNLVHQARPAMDQNVYLIARLKLEGEAPLLPGTINLFRDNAFIGQAYQDMLRPGKETDLAFGVDDQVTLKRQTVLDQRSEEGMISAQINLDRGFKTEFQNLHRFPVTIEVQESIPVAQNEKIKVTIDPKFTSPDYKTNLKDMAGVTQWVIKDLAPQATKAIQLGYRVSWPKNMNLNGM